jgi:hypothetical protein
MTQKEGRDGTDLCGHADVVTVPVRLAFIPRTTSQMPTIRQQACRCLFRKGEGKGQRGQRRSDLKQRDRKSKRTIPACRSTVAILLLAPGTSSFDWTSFSTARTTPSLHRRPITVPALSTALFAYSTCHKARMSVMLLALPIDCPATLCIGLLKLSG